MLKRTVFVTNYNFMTISKEIAKKGGWYAAIVYAEFMALLKEGEKCEILYHQDLLAKELNLTLYQVMHAIEQLKKIGVLEMRRAGRENLYKIIG